MPIIRLETKIDAPREIVFDLSRSIDLHKISTSHTNEEAIDGITSGLIEQGQFVTWRAKHFGIYQTLTTRITEMERPVSFVDELEKGIFKQFKHIHLFEEHVDQTHMIDIFDYTSPLGILGTLADQLFLQAYMKRLLEVRNRTIKDFAESGQWKEILPS